MTKKNIIIAVGLLASVALVGSLVINFNKQRAISNIAASNNYQQKQLNSVEVLESLDLNSDTPKIQLHVQTLMPEDHDASSAMAHADHYKNIPQVPEKILLIDKNNVNVTLELPVADSIYPNQCITHHHLIDTVRKWDTGWFTLSDLNITDQTYETKLSDKYTVMVVYKDGSSAATYSSVNPINRVCYQVAKVTPIAPIQDDVATFEE